MNLSARAGQTGAEKAVVDVEVKKLLNLKKQLALLTGAPADAGKSKSKSKSKK